VKRIHAGALVSLAFALLANVTCGVAASARTYFVDSSSGDDARSGLKEDTAWRSLQQVNAARLAPGDRVLFRRGQTWRGQLVAQSGSAESVVTYGAYGDGPKPVLLGSVAADRAEDWLPAGTNVWTTPAGNSLSVDVGNIIFDHGKATGFKRWTEADLKQDGDFFYDPKTRQVRLCLQQHPAQRYRSVELALRKHIIDQGGRGHVTYEDLDLRYGAAHGFGGGSTHHITIRGCDISYIGGGHQFTRPDGHPVRFGNGIEFWSSARDCLVEDCRLWEIYDAALTNQGDGTNVESNIVYRRNVIWNCEYSFEYWNRGPASRTENILFEHNTCVDAGFGWGHCQRPDPNGRHLMFYDNTAQTTNVVVRYNIFSRATDSLLRLHGRDWTAALLMDYNCWFQPTGAVALWDRETVDADMFASFMHARGLDAHSILGAPGFVNAAQHDYRLTPDSPARKLNNKNKPVGAL
jgi:hypothetical protein